MEFTTANKLTVGLLLLLASAQTGAASIGLPTRDQNPMLQAYYLPAMNMYSDNGWQLTHSLFVTNTFQDEDRSGETLVIDVENTRYDLSLAYQNDAWRFSSTLSFIDNDGGSLDSLIEDWHDFFGLPQGGRIANPDDRLNLSYVRDGETIFQQNEADSDIGDLALSVGYLVSGSTDRRTELGLGIELPTGSIDSNSGNEEIDAALWTATSGNLSDRLRLYGMLGVSFPGKGGQLQKRIRSQIWLSQFGTEYDFNDYFRGILQFDLHSAALRDSELKAFGESLQMQLALQINNWLENYSIDLFFSEDILVKSAPDITFGLRVSRKAF